MPPFGGQTAPRALDEEKRRPELRPVPPEQVQRALADALTWLDQGLDVRTILDPDFPSRLHEIFNREDLDLRAIAVVGTRQATADGKGRAEAHAGARDRPEEPRRRGWPSAGRPRRSIATMPEFGAAASARW